MVFVPPLHYFYGDIFMLFYKEINGCCQNIKKSILRKFLVSEPTIEIDNFALWIQASR